MAVICALLGFIPERRWLRHADKELAARFPRTIGLSGSNKQARKTFFLFSHMIGCWPWTPLYGATTFWVVDSIPVQCSCSRETVKRSDAAGCAEYGYCATGRQAVRPAGRLS